ncbi:tyrosine-type recombinase/integrase [Bacillus pseudomycoides]|uniref:tyrosine-type recombinase/integrase n=1 Tax=Bacillus pseudomycoides TaxID=64104 RepID=UPI000BEB70F9|nr:site-specific integrase [Bacillus pseudomycoides]PEB42252.1 integrase [Bacillus pseudomycoides]
MKPTNTVNIDSVESFLNYMQQNGRQSSTTKRYRYELIAFCKWTQQRQELCNKPIEKFNNNDMQLYLNYVERKFSCSKTTLKQKAVVVRNYLRYHNAPFPIENKERIYPLKDFNFATDQDINSLFETMRSYEGLSKKQISAKKYLMNRNILIVQLMLNHGLSLNDVATLTMHDVNLGTGIIHIGQGSTLKRHIELSKEEKNLLFSYYKDIPEILQPKKHSHDPFFIAFDFARSTFTWSYENDRPKELTKIAIHRMLKKENKRANTNITPSTLRNRFILNCLKSGVKRLEIKIMLGLKTDKSLERYITFYQRIAHTF